VPIVSALSAVLGWLGRQRTRAIAAVVIIAVAVPPVDALFRPFVTEAVFALLCIAFLRVDAAALRGHLKRPGLIIAATAWSSLALPIVFGICGLLLHLDTRAPDIFLALMLQAVASPMMAAPAFAALMGLDATLVLTTLVTSTALTPFSAPVFTYLFLGPALTLSPLALGVKLMAILIGSLAVAAVVRRLAGAAAIRRYDDQINGLNIMLVFCFVAAVMQDVAGRFIAAPLLMLELTAAAFVISFAVLGLTALVFLKSGAERSFVLGMMASQRNMGLMLAATGGALPALTWLYFALAQFPIYLSPLLLSGLARRVKASGEK
jgi:BASS family bile acid:Na+ symporter